MKHKECVRKYPYQPRKANVLRTKQVRQKRAMGDKFYAVNKATRQVLSAIEFTDGKRIAVGVDVWRMSNKHDVCDYPFEILMQEEFADRFEKMDATSMFGKRKEERAQIARISPSMVEIDPWFGLIMENA